MPCRRRAAAALAPAASLLALVLSLAPLAGCGDEDGPSRGGGCTLRVTAPESGAVWIGEQIEHIAWDATGEVHEVRIDLLRSDSLIAPIYPLLPEIGWAAWTADVHDGPTADDYRIRVAAADGDCEALSPPFTLINPDSCRFAVQRPDHQYVWHAGDEQEIRWTSASSSPEVKLELCEALTPRATIAPAAANDGSYLWHVTSYNGGSADLFYRIRISDVAMPGCVGYSEPFGLVDKDICELFCSAPADRETLLVGSDYDIAWAEREGSGGVKLVLFRGLQPLNLICGAVTGQETYRWRVTTYDAQPGYDYRIKITDLVDPYCWVYSDAFYILPTP